MSDYGVDWRFLKNCSVSFRFYAGMVLFSLVGTIASKTFHVSPGQIPVYASILTMCAGVLTLFKGIGSLRALIFTLCIGASSEILGLYTGYPFGRYEYTDRWLPLVILPKDIYFPILLPFAWFLIVGASWLSFSNVAGWKRMLSAAGLATFIDFLMEAVMVNKLRYWEWKRHSIYPGGADWMNPFGWFLVSLAACQALNFYSKPQTNNDSTEINEGRWVVGLYCVLMATLWLF